MTKSFKLTALNAETGFGDSQILESFPIDAAGPKPRTKQDRRRLSQQVD